MTLNRKRISDPTLKILAALLLCSLAVLVLHQHSSDEDYAHCTACQLAKKVAAVVFVLVMAIRTLLASNFFPVVRQTAGDLLIALTPFRRGPPVLA
ncbi:MAG: hypothetical protein HY587_02205 [Candidatus Omnitrophica bacterium]|nr:hypothetical protein [Candidatus Omnitrophota bacterium]